MNRLSGKVAIVTAAGSGIGRASARRLAQEGASVIVTDLRAEAAEATAASIREAGGTAAAMAVDVESEAAIKSMVDESVARFGRLDILHNNAALLDPEITPLDLSVVTIPADLWDRVMAVNVRSVMLGCKYAIPVMLENGGGSIINTGSTMGLGGEAWQVSYGTSKAAVIQLTKYVATHFGKQGIRCNAIAPALVMTPIVETAMHPELQAIHEENCLTPYLGQPEDIAAAVAFLASDDARYVTGHCLPVDGGTMAHLPTSPAAHGWLRRNLGIE
ncbi:SDR family NAD(P)-dependent oxidoreductase [Sphingobium chlorophenolicum]|uniref:3-oxoacyl-(Acyl-carrier-protein) reductase n=1 Tax=Sphingobium chlorophenolicum TaxID=46429 RepID=A0A081RA09_SPHCR|nr:glucose 1-dehydrogenase [Sphingobium chlorophenolicum]KEQ52032.1 3-oxoacyl-(Acyl-carrier-protein) reductase [Sphingobium chlorophenolicum]